MGVDNANLAALVGSRICHDLISPVGAINNGLELLGMSNTLDGPELELISDSVNNANARIRFFRVAFGAAGEQELGRAEVESVLADVSKGGRIKYNWSSDGAAARREVRMAFLAALCLETALPYGGTVQILRSSDSWTVVGEGRKINVDEALWSGLSGQDHSAEITPALIQFALLPEAAREAGRRVSFDQTVDKVSISF
ncbi:MULTISPECIES: histidine phosphotransferase family protein [unclassified Epibacterium]|jgi:histidine phosphotransferase ChpT|uniref:histidine phosphotransferase family protein n=1 Tax=unclassified Epibacterium TaxID=2639179 RepID=UPI001EF4B781|nr:MULTISPECIES: histidine phosphotransferase family protein [unclassified Epibacterium]MCG7622678.1 histidine phosphotransferase family protein [Epibacterium sp. Ofav1-8]MCG7626542.1 histidine phosphotransferase family protein [Epibacterium sp. MM17-32]